MIFYLSLFTLSVSESFSLSVPHTNTAVTSEHWISRERERRWAGLGWVIQDRGPRAAARQTRGPSAAARQARGPSAAARHDRGPSAAARQARGPRAVARQAMGPKNPEKWKFSKIFRGP